MADRGASGIEQDLETIINIANGYKKRLFRIEQDLAQIKNLVNEARMAVENENGIDRAEQKLHEIGKILGMWE